MQKMCGCSGHTYLPHLEQRDWHFWFFFRSPKVHRSLLFNEALFGSRVIFIFLVAKIVATSCDFFVIPHIFSKTDQKFSLLSYADVAFPLFISCQMINALIALTSIIL